MRTYSKEETYSYHISERCMSEAGFIRYMRKPVPFWLWKRNEEVQEIYTAVHNAWNDQVCRVRGIE